MSKHPETGSSCGICTRKLPHLLSPTDSMNYGFIGSTSLGFSLPPQSDTTLTFSCLTRLCKSELENDATSFSQTLWNLMTYASTGSTRLGQGIPARPKPKLISRVRSIATNGMEECAVQNPLSASTSTSAKSAVENTERKIAKGRRLGVFELCAEHPCYVLDCFEHPLTNRPT